jgi:ubiquinone/menaquinone biosynthesis C-methylase UbiE
VVQKDISSTGQTATDATWLDLHFEFDREIYTGIAQSVGIQQGWHVLDAGTGSGSFIPVLAEMVGPAGKITALDHDADNLNAVRTKLAASPPACEVETVVSGLSSIPVDSQSFDAVWVANVLMYFTDEELPGILTELQRVIRPDGLLAAKEGDQHLLTFAPLPMEILREVRPPAPVPPRIPGVFRSRQNIHHFRAAGLQDVRQWTVLNERHAPLDNATRAFAASVLQGMSTGRLESDANLSPEARVWLETQQDPESEGALVNHPQFSMCEAQVVTTGRVGKE